MSSTQGSTFDPHQILHRSSDGPPAAALRHHRRSVDRIWPPALEVKLARMSIDEGPAAGAHTHIIPAPPLVGSKDHEVDPTGWVMEDHRLEPIEEGVAIGAPSVVAGEEDTTALRERRRLSSVLGPLSPHYLLDEQHLPPYHQPRIDVQYRKRCKSISSLGGCLSHPDDKSNTTSGSLRINDAREGAKGLNEKSATTRHLSLFTSTSHAPASPVPSLFTLESDEFGPDLFHQRNPLKSLSSLSRSSSLTEFQKTLFPQQTGPLGQLSMPQGEVASSGHQDEGLKDVPLELPPPHPNPRPSFSPMSKNPLSPLSSRNTSPAHTPQRLRSPSPLTRVRSPLRDSNRHNIQLNNGSKNRLASQTAMPQTNFIFAPTSINSSKRFLRLNDDSSNSGQVLGVLTQRSGTMLDDQENTLTESPESPMGGNLNMVEPPMSLQMIPNDHDRWRSPTLSALASQTSSRGPSSPWQESYTDAIAAPKGKSFHGRQRQHLASQLQNDMEVEIPLIEAHDRVLLQDIWRMEDEERRDRLNGVTEDNTASMAKPSVGRVEDPVAHMKGEQHAHDEAKLIQQVLHEGHG